MESQQGPGEPVGLEVPGLLPQDLAPVGKKGDSVEFSARVPGLVLGWWEDPFSSSQQAVEKHLFGTQVCEELVEGRTGDNGLPSCCCLPIAS